LWSEVSKVSTDLVVCLLKPSDVMTLYGHIGTPAVGE
jgi:hypothetical protein